MLKYVNLQYNQYEKLAFLDLISYHIYCWTENHHYLLYLTGMICGALVL